MAKTCSREVRRSVDRGRTVKSQAELDFANKSKINSGRRYFGHSRRMMKLLASEHGLHFLV